MGNRSRIGLAAIVVTRYALPAEARLIAVRMTAEQNPKPSASAIFCATQIG